MTAFEHQPDGYGKGFYRVCTWLAHYTKGVLVTVRWPYLGGIASVGNPISLRKI
ncbi:MAG: hypothetical protein QGI86_20230 [Candidatus Poribacteria bacterium]|nr:hypothetical protein [Candidatus Poribacteria bacterium]MDP6995334.1 hypothetical protein [Candidatus Poribacteria bacterium]